MHDTLEFEDGRNVQISKCSDGLRKIKSPMCCTYDMTCQICYFLRILIIPNDQHVIRAPVIFSQ